MHVISLWATPSFYPRGQVEKSLIIKDKEFGHWPSDTSARGFCLGHWEWLG